MVCPVNADVERVDVAVTDGEALLRCGYAVLVPAVKVQIWQQDMLFAVQRILHEEWILIFCNQFVEIIKCYCKTVVGAVAAAACLKQTDAARIVKSIVAAVLFLQCRHFFEIPVAGFGS